MSLFDIRNPYITVTAFYALNLPEYSMYPHSHHRCEIMYVTKGSCLIYADGQEFRLRERQFIFLNADVLHQLSIPKGRPCSILNLEFSCLRSKTDICLTGLADESPAFSRFISRPGEYFPVEENGRGTYILNSRDLCMVEHIPDLLEAGVDSFKIEGRMKTALYVATAARTYRRAIDDYRNDPALYHARLPWYREQIAGCTYRQFTTGFFYGKPDREGQIYDNNTYIREYTYLGIVEERREGLCRITQRNKFSVGETVEVMKPDGRNIPATVKAIYNEDGQSVESAPHPRQVLWLDLGILPELYDLLRRQEELPELA